MTLQGVSHSGKARGVCRKVTNFNVKRVVLMSDENLGGELGQIWSRDIVIGPSVIHVKIFQIGATATNLMSFWFDFWYLSILG